MTSLLQPTGTTQAAVQHRARHWEVPRLDILLDDSISLDRAMALIADRFMHGNPAAQSTIDAVMYSLRSGVAALKRQDVRTRLATVDESQLRQMCALLGKRDGRIAPLWPDADIKTLIKAWVACHG